MVDKVSYMIQSEDGRLITKSFFTDTEAPDLYELVKEFYNLVVVDMGIESTRLDSVLRYYAHDPDIEENEEFVSVEEFENMPVKIECDFETSDDFQNCINENPGFKEFMFELFKENFEV